MSEALAPQTSEITSRPQLRSTQSRDPLPKEPARRVSCVTSRPARPWQSQPATPQPTATWLDIGRLAPRWSFDARNHDNVVLLI